jgi:hypothetical protein
MSAWFIDALDARAGIAFASERGPDLLVDAPELDVPGVLIAPPAFEPEVVAGRALAYAAGPGQFQLGLFVDEKEVEFETLDALAEFVRRTYLASGGGDSGNSIGPTPPPFPPEEGPPGIEPTGWPAGKGVMALVGATEEIAAASKELGGDVGAARRLALDSLTVDAGYSDSDALAYAGTLLIDGILDILPKEEAAAAAWLDAVERLSSALAALGLIEQIRLGPFWAALCDKLERKRRRAQWGEWVGDDGSWLLQQLFASADGRRVVQYPNAIHIEEWRDGWRFGGHSTDPLDDLEAWPLPSRLRSGEVQNLRDHLYAAIGAPLAYARRSAAEAAALLLFAAAHVATQARGVYAVGRSPFAPTVTAGIVAEALIWLRAQLPSFAFAAELEKIIAGAVELRSYEAAAASPLEGA